MPHCRLSEAGQEAGAADRDAELAELERRMGDAAARTASARKLYDRAVMVCVAALQVRRALCQTVLLSDLLA